MKSIRHNETDAEEMIRTYVKPLFGYALNRVKQREEAEDLAQEILLRLLKSVSAGANIRNLDAYVWTIAKYTWANWAKKHARAPMSIEVNGVSELLADGDPEPMERLLATETYRTLRREVSLLSDIHRRIVVLHYYEGRKQSEIAALLGIPVNTVKWHLHDAKKEIRKGMNRMQGTEVLSVNPIRLTNLGHAGTPGKLGETYDFLGRALAQNIVYAAYRKARTVREIAEELGMPPSLLEGEVRHLAEHEYLVESAPGKYRSNTIIWEETAEQQEAGHRLYQSCAVRIADAAFEALMDVREQVEGSGVSVPDRDYNFLLWTLLPKYVEEQAWRCLPAVASFEAVAPMRKDGGQYIAFGTLEKSDRPLLGFDPRDYAYCGAMHRWREDSPLYLWQLNTAWSDRQDWRHLAFEDVEICAAFRSGDLTDIDSNRERYSFLLEKGYIRPTADGYAFNAVWIDSPETLQRLNDALPDLTETYAPAIRRLYESLLNLTMQSQPKHLEPQIAHMVRGNACGGTLVTYALKHLVDNGKLKEPLPHQRKTITTWMGPVKR